MGGGRRGGRRASLPHGYGGIGTSFLGNQKGSLESVFAWDQRRGGGRGTSSLPDLVAIVEGGARGHSEAKGEENSGIGYAEEAKLMRWFEQREEGKQVRRVHGEWPGIQQTKVGQSKQWRYDQERGKWEGVQKWKNTLEMERKGKEGGRIYGRG